MNKKITKDFDFEGKKITFETGELALKTNSSVLASMGETVVLVTVTVSKEDTDRDYFPLIVEFIEKFYAGGIISGSRFVKRERFPSEEAILKARMIDRSIRPMFHQDFRKTVQVVITVLSYDEINDPIIIAINAVSSAILLSGIPFDGPIAGVKIGLIEEKLVLNPMVADLTKSSMDFTLSGVPGKIIMIDAGAKEVEEEKISETFDFADKYFPKIINFQKEFIKEVKISMIEFEKRELNKEIKSKIEKKYNSEINDYIFKSENDNEEEVIGLDTMKSEIIEESEGKYSLAEVSYALDNILKERVRKAILIEKKRPSGRKFDEVRKIDCRVGILPRTHGSALFTRGKTQALSIVTLGSTRLEQVVESFEGEETKRYMHHYTGQSFSLGEAGQYNYYPGRREIGHGALGEKSLVPVIPEEKEFPYTIRVVSEILSQQGSTSMAAVCGSTLALMDAGVQIKRPVAGIALGLVTSDDLKDYVLLTDVQALEDFFGDMDFKVAGSEKGITAIQMDNKLKGVDIKILKDGLKLAREARMKILKIMADVLPEPRKNLSVYAPKIMTIQINPEKISELIGPGGKVIKGIIEKTGTEIDIKEDGSVHISAIDDKNKEKAIQMINDICEEAEVGKIYSGEVGQVMPYGAFVDVSSSISGLVHISEISEGFVKDPTQFVKKGQKVKVKVIGIDDEGRINFSIKRVKQNPREEKTE